MREGVSRSVSVDAGGVQLHGLEWGAGGDPLLLLPGLGLSAHVYGELGPLLAAEGRAVAVTPRAHGASDTPPDGYTVSGFAADLLRVMDALGMQTAAVVAHSVSGAVATRLAAEHPERVRAVVYLDGIYDYAGRDDVVARNPFPPPPRPFFGTQPEQRAWMRRYVTGFWCDALEADLAARQSLEVESRRLELLLGLVHDVTTHPQSFAGVRCPMLALMAAESVESQFPWLHLADGASRQRAEAYLQNVRAPWRRTSIERFLWEAPHARVVEVPGAHHFFLTARDRVADEIRAFLSSPASPSES